ncbi:hypothetical protein BN6_22070 [Saccharothrix espanaensis DSM 44229]|uniref:Uncharacterized protein n=1 Tax=Saccharothrix espanaensis (strain ATCC 51144 / DSM 44229 / JCM 9112 / NBRC 15066 / NRRL 15764) TaxID=1179773 RepID=K0JZ44_SACES|nr:hypothetical protein BN6_22070 [Saccharothrix espanaensis DSM 44229]
MRGGPVPCDRSRDGDGCLEWPTIVAVGEHCGRGRLRHSRRCEAVLDTVRNVPFIDIVPVGPAGAGKSRLLAAMKQGLADWPSARAIRPDPVTALVLDEAWRSFQAAEPGDPMGTRRRTVVDLWFEAGPEGGPPLFETRLADYDGRAAAGARPDVGRALASRVRAADALLCVVDGERVAALLDGDRDGFGRSMAATWKLLTDPGKAVRFVVTKWDLVADRASLAQVREVLLGLPGFTSALRRLSARPAEPWSIGLIPVSVVGDDAGRQALVPLLSVLSQVLRTTSARAERAAGDGGSLAAGVGANWLSQAVTAMAVQQVLRRVVDAVPERRAARRYAGHAAVGVSMLVEAAVRTWCDRKARPSGDDVDSKQLARAAEAYEWQLRDFHREFPASDLTGAVSPAPGLLRRLVG